MALHTIVEHDSTHIKPYIDAKIGNFTEKNSDNEAYIYRQGKGNMVNLDLVGGSVAWNQLLNMRDFTNTTGGSVISEGTASTGSVNITSDGNNTETDAVKLYSLATTFEKSTFAGHKVLLDIGGKNPDSSKIRQKFYVSTSTGWGTTANILNDASFNPVVVSMPSDKPYFYWYLNVKASTTCDFSLKPQIIDLTQMFGSTIADYIYSLEQATAGAGVAWFRKYFSNAYYGYQRGKIESVNPSKRIVVGFNQWDEILESGGYDTSTGEKIAISTTKRSANFVRVLPNTDYYVKSNLSATRVFFYDANKNYINNSVISTNFTTDANVYYITFQCDQSVQYICINISKTTGSPKNGDYVPYSGIEYPFDTSVQLRGVPKLVNNKLSYDGDIYMADGTVTRKYGIVDLGTLTWTKTSTTDNHYRFSSSGISSVVKKPDNSVTKPNIICGKYITVTPDDTWEYTKVGISIHHTSGDVLVDDLSYSDAATFKTAMSGVYLVYELATSTTELASPYQNPQRAFIDGTEEFVYSGIAVPVGNNSKYYPSDALPVSQDYTDGAVKGKVDWESNAVLGAHQLLDYSLESLKALNTSGTWSGNAYTLNNVTYTVNDDMSISVSTTNSGAGAQTDLRLVNSATAYNKIILGQKINMSGCPSGGSASKYRMNMSLWSASQYQEYGNGVDVEIPSSINGFRVDVQVISGAVITTPVTFKPLIKLSADADNSFLPYAMTNQQLTEKVQSFKKAFLNIGSSSSQTVTINSKHMYLVYTFQPYTGGSGMYMISTWDSNVINIQTISNDSNVTITNSDYDITFACGASARFVMVIDMGAIG